MQILLTGAGKGIGYAATRYALAKGHQVIAISRDTTALQNLQNEYTGLEILPFDLAESDMTNIETCLQRAGKVDVLINNAGVLINKPFEALTSEDWAYSLNVNLLSVVRIIQTCLPFMRGAGKANILNVSSMGGFQGSSKFTGLAAYSTSKGALVTLTEFLAAELVAQQIHVNCVCLGAVDTAMLQQAFPAYRAPITAEEMGQYLIDFCTTQAHLFNGKILPVAVSVP